MKRFFVTLFFVTIMGTMTFAQGWRFISHFPDTNLSKGASGVHGLAVDPEGKLWVQFHGANVWDTVFVPDSGRFLRTRAIYIYNKNGTPASFSPMYFFDFGTSRDFYMLGNNGRGLTTDHEGNILVSVFQRMYKIDYRTGRAIRFVNPGNVTLGAPAVAANGTIFIAAVINPQPIRMYDKDFNSLGNALDSVHGFHRSMGVSPDGNTIWWGGYTLRTGIEYRRTDEFSPFTVRDTVLKGFSSESFGWNRKYARLWAAAGSGSDLPNLYPGAVTSWSVATWYAFNPTNRAITDSLKWVGLRDSPNQRPRAIAFSPGGDTAYVGVFGSSTIPSIQVFVNPNPGTNVRYESPNVPSGFELTQNYPNPFNPSTDIKFTVAKEGAVRITVYDILGNIVRILVDDHLKVGQYSTQFDATNLASGTYIYELRSQDVRMTKKMMLMK
ncbi:MAG: hypothetical protein C0425_08605 [Chlorobiaceae bacterium]|nr:hypothetical protein [Chlorobiaceae bacterium]MBA4310381.1 hypothetical protein [Chlorobiaceae bacterium]